MKKRTEEHSIDSLFVLLLFGIYGALIVILLLLGAGKYKDLVKKNNESYNQRIGVSYIAAKVRHNDTEGGVDVGGFSHKKDGIETLHLYQSIDREVYDTRIYYYKGYIRELLTLPGVEAAPEDGNPIMQAKALEFSKEEHLLGVRCVDGAGAESTMCLYLRSEEEELP
ncbi:MAG: DUF4860 domain-containing protein [Lachnospiraceae bacterium]